MDTIYYRDLRQEPIFSQCEKGKKGVMLDFILWGAPEHNENYVLALQNINSLVVNCCCLVWETPFQRQQENGHD
jgi:hypothetical protein